MQDSDVFVLHKLLEISSKNKGFKAVKDVDPTFVPLKHEDNPKKVSNISVQKVESDD